MKKNEIVVFTDGASRGNPGRGGYAAVIIYDNQVVEIAGGEKRTTNNRMELTAAIEALDFISKKTNPENNKIIIYTDSAYLVNGITLWVYSWERRNWTTKNKQPVLNKDLWEKLLGLVRDKKIEWRNIEGHVGIRGNERADKIASLFADNKEPSLYSGARGNYPIKNVGDISFNELKQRSKKNDNARSRAKAYSYVSMVEGMIKTHGTWAETEKRVKGKDARFKKALSIEEEKQIIGEFKNE